MKRPNALAVAFVGMSALCHAALGETCAKQENGGGVVVELLDQQLLALDDARVVTLASVQFPRFISHGGLQIDTATILKAAMTELTLGKKAALRFSGRKTDRYGRHLAQVDIQKGEKTVWLQQTLVEMGLAVVDASSEERECAHALLAAEDKARRARSGFWAQGLFTVRDGKKASLLRGMVGTFQIVQGAVSEVTDKRGAVAINFGADAKTAFNVSVDAKTAKMFTPPAIAPAQFKGKTIRVRGWLMYRNGPTIVVTHPEQIEIIAEEASRSP